MRELRKGKSRNAGGAPFRKSLERYGQRRVGAPAECRFVKQIAVLRFDPVVRFVYRFDPLQRKRRCGQADGPAVDAGACQGPRYNQSGP